MAVSETKTVSVRLPTVVADEISRRAQADGLTVNHYLSQIIIAALHAPKQEDPPLRNDLALIPVTVLDEKPRSWLVENDYGAKAWVLKLDAKLVNLADGGVALELPVAMARLRGLG